jgi:DNA processing protein
MSELPPGARPTRWRFLQRNRIIAALGRATLVVEAGHRSGAINTANHALSLGRPLGAVPGQVNRSTSDGCHRLIRDSFATLISSSSDLLDLIGLSETVVESNQSLGALELRALDALTLRFQDQHAILNKAGLTSLELSIAMGALELAGLAERNERGYWRKTLNL